MKTALLSILKEKKKRLHLTVHLQASNAELTRSFYYQTTLDKLAISFICEFLSGVEQPAFKTQLVRLRNQEAWMSEKP